MAVEADAVAPARSEFLSSKAVGASFVPPTSIIVMAALESAIPSLTIHSIVRSVVLGSIRLVFS